MEKLRQLRVGDFKSLPISIRDNISIYDAIVTMFTQNVGSLTVVGESQTLRGMVSRKDLLKSALGKTDLQQVPVSMVRASQLVRFGAVHVPWTTPDSGIARN